MRVRVAEHGARVGVCLVSGRMVVMVVMMVVAGCRGGHRGRCRGVMVGRGHCRRLLVVVGGDCGARASRLVSVPGLMLPSCLVVAI